MDAARSFDLHAKRSALTIVELLVVITIIGLLIALLLPAIQASRESARKTQCRNNLKQLGFAAQNHLNSTGFFPTGGWGWSWAGDPDQGFGNSQPGGWIYCLLPYIEEKALWSAGKGIDINTDPSQKRPAAAAQMLTPIPLVYCPSRRDAIVYPYMALHQPVNVLLPVFYLGVLKTDYAANVGDSVGLDDPGPTSMAGAAQYSWLSGFTGVTFQHSQVPASLISDGLSHTYFAGEKYLDPANYATGLDLGDNDAATQGYDNDMLRMAGSGNTPMQDTRGTQMIDSFGSAHPEGFNMVFCDCSVHLIDYAIDPIVHNDLANRADGQTVSSKSIH